MVVFGRERNTIVLPAADDLADHKILRKKKLDGFANQNALRMSV